MKQRSFFDSKSEHSKCRVSHGGSIGTGKAKIYRPLDRRRPLHVEIKSSAAKGPLSLLKHKLKIDQLVRGWAAKCGVTIHDFENMGNHLHLLVSFKLKTDVQKFFRVITGLIARLITKAERGSPFGRRFWDDLVFSRIVTGKRDYLGVLRYMAKNRVQRDAGPAWREGMELAEDIAREARRRRVSVEQVKYERLEMFLGTGC